MSCRRYDHAQAIACAEENLNVGTTELKVDCQTQGKAVRDSGSALLRPPPHCRQSDCRVLSPWSISIPNLLRLRHDETRNCQNAMGQGGFHAWSFAWAILLRLLADQVCVRSYKKAACVSTEAICARMRCPRAAEIGG